MRAGLSRQQRHDPRRPGGRRRDAALFHRAFRQPLFGARLRRDGRHGGERARANGCARCSAPRSAKRSCSPPAGRKPTIPRSSARSRPSTARDEIVVSAVEHPAVLALVSHLERTRRHQGPLSFPSTPVGRLDRARYRAALSTRVALVSIMWANNETGVVFPVEELAEEAKIGRRALPHRRRPGGRAPADRPARHRNRPACRSPPTSCMDPRASARSTCARGAPLRSLMLGGNQERGRRGGTENTSRASSASARRPKWPRRGCAGDAARMRALRDRLEARPAGAIPRSFVLGDVEPPAAEHRVRSFAPGAEADAIVLMLNRDRGRRLDRRRLLRRLARRPRMCCARCAARRRRTGRDALFAVARQLTDDDIDRVIATHAVDRREVARPSARARKALSPPRLRRAGLCLSARPTRRSRAQRHDAARRRTDARRRLHPRRKDRHRRSSRCGGRS